MGIEGTAATAGASVIITVIAKASLGPRRRSQASSLHNLRCRDLHVCAILQHISAAFVIISLAFVLQAKQENAGSETGPREGGSEIGRGEKESVRMRLTGMRPTGKKTSVGMMRPYFYQKGRGCPEQRGVSNRGVRILPCHSLRVLARHHGYNATLYTRG